jgi:hypothetical protein
MRSAKEPAAGAVSRLSDIAQILGGYHESWRREGWRGGRGVKKSSKWIKTSAGDLRRQPRMTSIKPQEEWKKSKIQPKERRAITKENNSSLSEWKKTDDAEG